MKPTLKTTMLIIAWLFHFLLNHSLAQTQEACADFRVYGDENNASYLKFESGEKTRIIYFDEVAVYKTDDPGYLIAFPIFGLAPVLQGNKDARPSEMMNRIPDNELEDRFSRINLFIRPDSPEPYYFTRSALSSIDCVLDRNRFNPSLADLLNARESEMQHQIKEEGGKVQIDFRSVALQDTSFSMSMRVVTETIPNQELVGNFRASAVGDTLNPRVFLYPKGGFMNYQTRYGLMKTVPLPGKDGMLSGYIFKDRVLVYQFRELSAEEVSFNTHRVERSNENNRERAIRDPLETSEVSLEDFELNSETLEGSIISGELVVIGGEPVWIDQKNLPEEEQYYGSPVRLNLSGKEIGLADLPEEQSFPLSRKMQAFRYSLVDRNLQTIEVTVSEAPENYFIDIKRGDLEDLETKLHLIEFQETAGEYAETVKDFILYASENYRALNEKDIVWWKEQMESMNVELPDSDNTMDYFRAIEDKYKLNNNVINAIAREYYRENYPEVEIAYSVIIASRSNRGDTTEHAHKLTNSAFEMDITLKSPDWFGMSMELEDSLRKRYSDNLITWALESAGERLDPVSRFTMTSDLDGNIRKAGYLSPSGYDRLKINYMHKGDSTGISLSHPLQENEQRFFETGTGIWDVHYLLGFLPWFELEGKGSKSYYFIDTRGNTYGSSFYITPVFYRVNISQESEQTIEYMGRQIGTYKLRLTFNRPVERPSIFPSGLSMDDSLQPSAEIWLSTKKPHLPVKMQVKNEVYWRGPDPIDPKQSEEWFRWTGY